jgi:hypothetical protein
MVMGLTGPFPQTYKWSHAPLINVYIYVEKNTGTWLKL